MNKVLDGLDGGSKAGVLIYIILVSTDRLPASIRASPMMFAIRSALDSGAGTGPGRALLSLATPRSTPFNVQAEVSGGDRDRLNPTLQTFNALYLRGAYLLKPALVGPFNHLLLDPMLEVNQGQNTAHR